ncbi:MAG: hypothetical protein K5872_22310 [Rhizobiaceae bacterium]|nr:hypothetical protein [Rhizobiaceae bacterium]
MAVRDVRFADIPAIVALLQDGHRRSIYALDPRVAVDVREVKRLLVQAIQRHGHTTGGGCWIQVAETDGRVTGVILGTLVRLYAIFTPLMATDVFWLASEDVHPADPMKLMAGMIKWAKASPDVAEIRCATTGAIASEKKTGVLLERLGMEPFGEVWKMKVEAQ